MGPVGRSRIVLAVTLLSAMSHLAVAKARAQANTLDKFFSRFTHELRNPINGLIDLHGLLVKNIYAPEEQVRFLD